MKYPSYVGEIIEKLEENGYEAYIVGGSVRDIILGKEPNDYDVTTSALPEKTLEIFSDKRTIPTGLKHGTVTVMTESGPIEVTTFRVDGEYKDKRRPESVSFTGKVAEDLARRDFTVNAMAYSERNGLIDLFEGKRDIERRIIRAVGEPRLRFSEDALRILRAFRFSAQLGFDIEKETLAAAVAMKDGLLSIASERTAAELIRTICSSTPITSLKLMKECGILGMVMDGYIPNDSLIEALPRALPEVSVRFGMLLAGADKERARGVLRSLKLSNKLTSDISRIAEAVCVRLCGREADARRFVGCYGELAPSVLEAARALGRLDGDFERYVNEAIEKKECATGSALKVNGGDIVKLGARGREVGRLLEYLLERVIEEPDLNEKETLLSLAEEKIKERRGGENG